MREGHRECQQIGKVPRSGGLFCGYKSLFSQELSKGGTRNQYTHFFLVPDLLNVKNYPQIHIRRSDSPCLISILCD